MASWNRARVLIGLLAFVFGVGTVPHRICERDAPRFFDGEPAKVDALASSVARWTGCGAESERSLDASSFATGSQRFDQEWLFGSYMMAAMGFGQSALASPLGSGRRAESIARMEYCLDALLEPKARTFDRDAWGNDPLASIHLGEATALTHGVSEGTSDDRGHAAYLGYSGLALGLHRLLVPTSRFDALHDALVATLARRIQASDSGFIETYPGESYPVDNASAFAAIALHARATGSVPSPALARGLAAIRGCATNPSTGLLVQSLDEATRAMCAGASLDGGPNSQSRRGAQQELGRGSGTALAAFFLAYADTDLSKALYRAVHEELYRTVLGFGAVLEHPMASGVALTDIDSGPTMFGFGVSATGFTLGASRIHDDRDAFTSLYATTHLFGAPYDEGTMRTYVTGGPLGDAILFAMTTAPHARDLEAAYRLRSGKGAS